jgi:hypothetical protein
MCSTERQVAGFQKADAQILATCATNGSCKCQHGALHRRSEATSYFLETSLLLQRAHVGTTEDSLLRAVGANL